MDEGFNNCGWFELHFAKENYVVACQNSSEVLGKKYNKSGINSSRLVRSKLWKIRLDPNS